MSVAREVFGRLVLLSAVMMSAVTSAKPEWMAQDYKSPAEWGFFCEGDGKTEATALAAARAICAQKICQLFGIELESQTVTNETLKAIDVTTTTVERCPKIRVVGRKEKKKNVGCEDDACLAYVLQTYPKAEYEKEYKRLNQPKISQVLEQTIVIREGNDTFRDPKACRAKLAKFPEIHGESPESAKARTSLLRGALADCRGLDYRNADLQEELKGYLVRSFTKRSPGIALSLNDVFSRQAKLDDKIEAFAKFEERQAIARGLRKGLEKRLAESFDALWARDNFLPEQQQWVDASGRKQKASPYLQELASCSALTGIVLAWPGDYGEEISVCVPAAKGDAQDCRTASILMLRAQFAGCICRRDAPERDQDCTRMLMQSMRDACPAEASKGCLDKAFAQAGVSSGR